VRTPHPGLTPWRTRPAIKGPKAHKGKKGYGLKIPRRLIKVLEFKGWPTNRFTTTQGTTEVRDEDRWAC
jgi:hypothetical protein